ncbi:MAG: glycosyltransferase family 2 protein [Alphaproteobacteria bacterium]|nr:glycosyltransferase family 2 protein [Alphaproteobacteria bacterium]
MIINVSIITITFNNRTGLKKTAQSILSQTCTDYEWIIIDGASTDGTQDDFPLYKTAQITSEPDHGIYDAMNKGIKAATGKYIIFMNAGDQFATPEILQSVSEETAGQFFDLVYGDSYEEQEQEIPFYKSAKPATSIHHGLFTHHQSIFYNRLSLEDLRYDTKYKIAADYDLTLRFLQRHDQSLYIAEPICIYEGGGISQTQIELGRHEQYLSRKLAGVPEWKNRTITTKQKAASFLRRLFPNLYWKTRSFIRGQSPSVW